MERIGTAGQCTGTCLSGALFDLRAPPAPSPVGEGRLLWFGKRAPQPGLCGQGLILSPASRLFSGPSGGCRGPLHQEWHPRPEDSDLLPHVPPPKSPPLPFDMPPPPQLVYP